MNYTPLRDLRERVVDVPQSARAVAKIAQQSGVLWDLRASAIPTVLRVLARKTKSPSHIYRIHAANSPDKPALLWRDESMTFRALDERMDSIAAALRKRGIGKGASVLLMMRNRPEFVQVQIATARIAGAAVSVSWRSTPSELLYLAAHCGARAIFFEHDLFPTVDEARKSLPDIDAHNFFSVGGEAPGCARFEDLLGFGAGFVPDARAELDASVVIYTSGTTGKPKGAVRKFSPDALGAALKFISETPMRSDDIHLVACPLYHSTAFAFLSLTHMLGGTGVLMDEFKPEPFLQQIARYGVTSTAVVPTMLHRVLALGDDVLARYDTHSLRLIFSGGAPLPGPLGTATMDRFGDILYNFYGATETGLVTVASPVELRAAPGSIGHAIPGNRIRLLDDAGNDVKSGEVGELYARSKMLVAGYHRDEGATRSSMKDGYFSVGDLARVDSEGRYFIEGRKRDMVISGGVKVYPAEVEAVLEAHPDVAEVAVIGVPDSDWGERVCAFVVRRLGADLDEAAMKTWVRERLAGPKCPRDYVFLDALPRNPTGKVLKRDLREFRAP